jgi:hypothetical protein
MSAALEECVGGFSGNLYQAYELRVRPQICDLLADGKKNFLRPGPAESRTRRYENLGHSTIEIPTALRCAAFKVVLPLLPVR